MRGGVYPAPAEAVAYAATALRSPTDQPFSILDPCAGEGAAIQQLGELLGCPQEMTFAIELDESRAEKLRATLAQANVLAPASCFGCRASLNSFSFIWLNPPFDHSYGGHRMENQFLLTATDWLMPGGVMALICPEDVADEYSDVRRHFASHYQNCKMVPFPAEHRQFNEVMVFGQKRHRPQVGSNSWESVLAREGFIYRVPSSPGPRIFHKVEPTEPELQRMLVSSPLRSRLMAPPAIPIPSPPLAPGIGHVALLLASGHLDGMVRPQSKPPHVVRGTSRKRELVSDVTETQDDEGRTVKRTTISERIELVVRAVDLTGEIRTFMDGNADEQPEAEPEQRREDNGAGDS
jgi:hypothetical protein